MSPKERAEHLKERYSKNYLREVVVGYKKQNGIDKEYWSKVGIELGKLYKQ